LKVRPVTAAIPKTEPAAIAAGDTAKWSKTLADYPADQGWALNYELVNASQRYTFAAAASGSDFLVTVAAATTAGWVVGDYAWRARVSKASEVYTVGEGRVTVGASFASATDTRSQARRILEAIEATLEGRASSAVERYTIAGRELRHYLPEQLLVLRDRYRADVRREEAAERMAQGLPNPSRVYVRHIPS
jgi:hypothetical protein